MEAAERPEQAQGGTGKRKIQKISRIRSWVRAARMRNANDLNPDLD